MSIKDIIKHFGGAGKVASEVSDLTVYPTEFKQFNDIVLGCGGLPVGKAIEIYGMESSGKSTLAQNLVAHIQKRGGTAAWFDAEQAAMKPYMQSSGIDLDNLAMPEFGYGEDMLYKVQLAIALNINVVVIDSIQAVRPKALSELPIEELSMKDKLMAASMWTAFFDKIEGGFEIYDAAGERILSERPTAVLSIDDKKTRIIANEKIHRLSTSQTCLILINHKKKKIGSFFTEFYTPGGTRKNFSFSARIDILSAKKKFGKEDGDKVLKHKEVKIRSSKNKLAPPFGQCLFKMYPSGLMEEVEDSSQLGAVTEDEETTGSEGENDI